MKRGGQVQNGSSRDVRKTSQGYVNIKNLTAGQLDELIERQKKLLKNKSFLEKLPDKGQKILSYKAELEVELKRKQEEYNATCDLLCNLCLIDKNSDEIEWNNGKITGSDKQLDSDDDDDDDDDTYGKEGREVINPLKYIATHSGTATGKKIKIHPQRSKVVDKDSNIERTLYADKYCEKYDEKSIESSCKERFKPNTLKNGDKTLFVTSAEKLMKRLGDKWEITQATPPAPIYTGAVMISLTESLKLQKLQAKKLKEIEKKNATEKLLENMSVKMRGKLPTQNITEYRSNENFFDSVTEIDEDESQDSDSENENCFIENNEFES